jgi:Transcriptional regulator PadR-like family
MGKARKIDSLGQFEQLVLTAILTLRGDAYGVTIHAKVEELAEPKDISLGAVYVTLDRLEDKGLVSSCCRIPRRNAAGAPSAATGSRRGANARCVSPQWRCDVCGMRCGECSRREPSCPSQPRLRGV